MFGIYTQFGLSSNYSFNKNCTIPYFINLISDRANLAVSGTTSFKTQMETLQHEYMCCDYSREYKKNNWWRETAVIKFIWI